MKFIDLFSGVGGFRSALEELEHECIAFSEIDKFAIESYKAIYDTDSEIELGDISEISDEYISKLRGEVDLVVGGSPCQSFSIAGNRGGFDDTRGTLFFEYARTVDDIKPKYFIYENVKGMLSHDKGSTIKTVLNTFNELGYYIDFNIFNSKYYGVPQNRERIYIVGKRKDLVPNPKFHEKKKRKIKVDEIHNWAVENIRYVELLPELKTTVNKRLVDVLEDEVDEKYYLSEEKTRKLTLNQDLGGKLNMYDYNERDKVYSVNKVSPTLNTMQGGDRQPKIAIKSFKEIVEVRKYEVPIEELQKILRESKDKTKLTINQISTTLDIPKTKVEHWFRTDSSFSIPDREVWYKLKHLLEIETSEFDKAITEFVLKESEFDTTNRVYDPNHLSPTINSTSEPKIAVVGNTSRTNHNSHNIYDSNGLAPTIAARDYKGAKQILIDDTQLTGEEQGVVTRKLYSLEDLEERFMNEKDILKQGKIKQIIFDEFGVGRKCNKCNNQVLISDIKGYPYLCFECDENLFEMETYKDIEMVIGSTQKNAAITDGTISPALTSAMGQGGGHVPMPVYKELTGETNQGVVVEKATQEPKLIKIGNVYKSGGQNGNVHDTEGVSPTISSGTTNTKGNGGIGSNNAPKIIETTLLRIRKLTPKECWRLQGFTDEQFDKAQQAGLSNSQLYKQAGNAVTVNVVKYIAKHLIVD